MSQANTIAAYIYVLGDIYHAKPIVGRVGKATLGA